MLPPRCTRRAKNALLLTQEFQPTFGVEDILNLPNYDIYLKLMIDGTPSRPFSARTLTGLCDLSFNWL